MAAPIRAADLRGGDLFRANLGGANLRQANLREANLREAGPGRGEPRASWVPTAGHTPSRWRVSDRRAGVGVEDGNGLDRFL
jgi:hypothetical protein